MTHIITVTPNPAIDVSTTVSKIAPFSKLRCASAQRDPGGGGINVARVVNRLGGAVSAIYPAGGNAGQLLRQLMDGEGVHSLAIQTLEETREDFTVYEETTRQQYRFVLPGARLTEHEWQQCLEALASIEAHPTFIVASGSLPPGAPDDLFARVARSAKQLNARVVVDTSGAPLKAALREGVYLIKPNLREFQELTSKSTFDETALVQAGRELIDRGLVEVIALSLGSHGALLIARDQALRADGLPIKPASVVGAGDSFLGAMVWSLACDNDLDAALRRAIGAGSAALLNPGTELARPDDIQRLASQVVVRPVYRIQQASLPRRSPRRRECHRHPRHGPYWCTRSCPSPVAVGVVALTS